MFSFYKVIEFLSEGEYGGKGKYILPSTHLAAMKVPKGGSMCANCKWIDETGKLCFCPHFIEWNGSEVIPGKADEYCSDWYQPK